MLGAKALRRAIRRALVRSKRVLPLLQMFVLNCSVVQRHGKHRCEVRALSSGVWRLACSRVLSHRINIIFAPVVGICFHVRERRQALPQENQGLQDSTGQPE